MSFTLPVTSGKTPRKPLPRGFVNAICADFYTKMVDDNFNPGQKKLQAAITFITTHKIKNKDNEDIFGSITLFVNASWGGGEKPSKLRKFITSWFGPLTDNQLAKFDFEKLLGKQVCILINHYKRKDGSDGDSVDLATDLRSDLPIIDSIPVEYVRMKDRGDRASDSKANEDDLPF